MNTTTKFEVGKWYKRGNGDLIRVVCVDAPGDYPVIGVCEGGSPWTFTRSGQQTTMGLNSSHDLTPIPIEPKKKGVVWVNVFPLCSQSYGTLEMARGDAFGSIARIRVEWEENQFDD
jgi:hypothetical protein